MCIFTSSVEAVSSTRIFARMEGNRQAIVYDLFLSTPTDTAMVLPIPSKNVDAPVTFVDFSSYQNFFDELGRFFPVPLSRSLKCAALPEKPYLEVKQVGSFEASFVPSQKDFNRLSPDFRLTENLLQSLPQYRHYGFVVFKLRRGESNIHPMAFWFETVETDQLFYPTVHIHDGEFHAQEQFDHTLYAQGNLTKHTKLAKTEALSNSDTLKEISFRSSGIVSHQLEIYKQSLVAELPNKDTWLSV